MSTQDTIPQNDHLSNGELASYLEPNPVTDERADFFCRPLGENPSAYDRYLVRT